MSLISLSDIPGLPCKHAGWELATITQSSSIYTKARAARKHRGVKHSYVLEYERGSLDDDTLESREIRISDHPARGGRNYDDPDDDDDAVVYVGPHGDPARSPDEIAEIVRRILTD